MRIIQLLAALSWLASDFAFNFSCVLPIGESWFVPGYQGVHYRWTNRSVAESEMNVLKNESDLVTYHLYTEDNPTSAELLILGDSSTLHQSKFNKSNPTRVISHGFQASHNTPACTLIRDAYLKTGPHNIICIDYSKIAKKSYPVARCLAPNVGTNMGKFIEFLLQAGGISKKKLVVIGHSLGSQVVGFAGKHMKKINNTLPLIVVLDPAFPLFPYEDCSSRICNEDAEFVESIQTTAGIYGYFEPIGDGAYYPNGGIIQPGCGLGLHGMLCGHTKSCKYFAEAIEKNNFPTKKCADFTNAVTNQCENKYSSVKMGSVESFGVKGVFFVRVNSDPPYGMG